MLCAACARPQVMCVKESESDTFPNHISARAAAQSSSSSAAGCFGFLGFFRAGTFFFVPPSSPPPPPAAAAAPSFASSASSCSLAYAPPSSFLAEDACQICYDACEVIDGVAAGRTSCGHLFHRGCLARWLQEAKVCGVCRSPCPSTLRMFAADEATSGDP